MRKRTSRRSQSQYRHKSKASSRPPPTGLLPNARLVRAFPFVARSIGIAQPSSLNIPLRAHFMFVTLGLSTRKKTLFDNGVNAPISVHHLGHAEVDGYRDQRDCLVLAIPSFALRSLCAVVPDPLEGTPRR